VGYLEVNVICPCKSPPIGRLASVRTVEPHRGECHNSSANFKINQVHTGTAPKKACSQCCVNTDRDGILERHFLIEVSGHKLEASETSVSSGFLSAFFPFCKNDIHE
jgi:hypothetical protein